MNLEVSLGSLTWKKMSLLLSLLLFFLFSMFRCRLRLITGLASMEGEVSMTGESRRSPSIAEFAADAAAAAGSAPASDDNRTLGKGKGGVFF